MGTTNAPTIAGGPRRKNKSKMSAQNTTTALTQEYTDESRAHWLLIPSIIFTVLLPLLVALRFHARKTGTGNGLRADDWTCLAATISALATNAIFIATTHYGFGHHMLTIPPEALSAALGLWWFSQMTYKISLQLTKISLLLLYMRIFGHIPWFKRTVISFITILILYTLASCTTSLLQCRPISDAWAVRTPGAPRTMKQCIDMMSFFIFNGSFAVFTDLIVLLLPLPLIYTLRPARHQNLALVPLLALGTFIVVISSQRLYFLAAPSKPGSNDKTYDLIGTLWTIIEYNLGVVCACLPIVRVYVLRSVGCVEDGNVRVIDTSLSGRSSSRGVRDIEEDEFDLIVSQSSLQGWYMGLGNGAATRGTKSFVSDDTRSEMSLIIQSPGPLLSPAPEGGMRRYDVEYEVIAKR